jgi:hypothetical protein
MRRLALKDQADLGIVSLASYLGTPAALDEFLRRYWRVVPDPLDAEFIRAPFLQLLQFIERAGRPGGPYLEGDCDDAATLAGAILAAMGEPFTFVAIRLQGDLEFSHVWVRAGALDIDPIVPAELLPLPPAAETLELSLYE